MQEGKDSEKEIKENKKKAPGTKRGKKRDIGKRKGVFFKESPLNLEKRLERFRSILLEGGVRPGSDYLCWGKGRDAAIHTTCEGGAHRAVKSGAKGGVSVTGKRGELV